MPRTKSPRKRTVRVCGDCGYELATDNDGSCLMCPRFEQMRLDFTVPRPSDLAAHRPDSRSTDVSGVSDEWPPTVAEYRAILAERRLRSDSPAQPAATVIRTAAMRQTQVPPPPRGATAPDDGALTSPAIPKPPAKAPLSSSPPKAEVRRGQGKSRRAARVRVRSSGAPETMTPPATASSSALVELGDGPATPGSSTPPKSVGPLSVTSAATRSEGPGNRLILPLPDERLVITVAIVVASALIGAAVPTLLSLL